MWSLPSYSEFAAPDCDSVCRLDLCRFGIAWRKRTRFCVNGVLAGARLFCQCRKPHLVLRGRSVEHGRAWTSVARSFPRPLLDLLGSCASVHSGRSRAAPRVGGVRLSVWVPCRPPWRSLASWTSSSRYQTSPSNSAIAGGSPSPVWSSLLDAPCS